MRAVMLQDGTPKRHLNDGNRVPMRANTADHRMKLTNTLDPRPTHAVSVMLDQK